mmetsp:Transcript_97857/g.245186  ORF Transcript_97857/g.245186 Transcript_97857/m.245186 type:complete len:210 (+) Transcript_97857:586-1215(+)
MQLSVRPYEHLVPRRLSQHRQVCQKSRVMAAMRHESRDELSPRHLAIGRSRRMQRGPQAASIMPTKKYCNPKLHFPDQALKERAFLFHTCSAAACLLHRTIRWRCPANVASQPGLRPLANGNLLRSSAERKLRGQELRGGPSRSSTPGRSWCNCRICSQVVELSCGSRQAGQHGSCLTIPRAAAPAATEGAIQTSSILSRPSTAPCAGR